MTINLTPKQYRSLLKAIYWAGWMKSAMKTEMDAEGMEIEALQQHIYSNTEQFQTQDWVTYVEELEGYYPTQTMEAAVHPVIDEFENDSFWDELINRLAQRDTLKKHRMDNIQEPAVFLAKLQPFLEKYEDEFERNGLENLRVS